MRTLILLAAAIVSCVGLLAIAMLPAMLFSPGMPVGPVVLVVSMIVAAVVSSAAYRALLWLLRLDDDLKRQAVSDRATRADERFMALLALAHAHDFELKVKGATQFSFALIAFALGSTAFLLELHWMLRVLIVMLCFPIGIWLLLQAIAQLGHPVITLTRAGFRTPTSPEISWRLVDGVHYTKTTLSPNDSEAPPYGTLTFYIPTLRQEALRFTRLFRLTQGLRGVHASSRIIVTLRKTSEPTGVVGRLAEHLWMRDTGRTNDWVPSASDAVNTAYRELKAADVAFHNLMESGDPNPVEFEKHLALLERNSKILLENGRSTTRQGYWVVVILVLIVAGFVVGGLVWIF